MSRIGSKIIVGSVLGFLLFACGDKNYPPSPYGSGGDMGSGGIEATGGSGGGGTTEIVDYDSGITGDIDGGGIDGGGGAIVTGTGGASGSGGAGGSTTAAVSFSKQVLPLMQKSCSCHMSASIPPQLNNYANVSANAESSLTSIKSGSMPPSGALSAADKDMFQSWISAGKPNN
jgi:hypothetical protein